MRASHEEWEGIQWEAWEGQITVQVSPRNKIEKTEIGGIIEIVKNFERIIYVPYPYADSDLDEGLIGLNPILSISTVRFGAEWLDSDHGKG